MNYNVEDFEQMVNEYVNKNKVVTRIPFTSVTPWWGGDYEGNTARYVDEDEIIGRLRWFLRTVYNRFFADAKDLDSYAEAEKFVSEILGSTSNVSQYIFKVNDCDAGGQLQNIRDQPRVKLTLMGEKDENQNKKLPLYKMKFTLEILRTSSDSKYDDIIVGGTLITLAYLGIGKGANRGFGRFIPDYGKCNIQFGKEICEAVVKGDIEEAFSKFYNAFKDAVKSDRKDNHNKWTESRVPLAPLVFSSNDNADKITNTNCTTNDHIRALEIIQYAFLKCTLKKLTYQIEIRDPAPYIHTWIYGLPRNVKGTGYVSSGKDLRRQSMFIVTPVKKGNQYTIYILPFLSFKDNLEKTDPNSQDGEIMHAGGKRSPVSVGCIILDKPEALNKKARNLANKNKQLSFGDTQSDSYQDRLQKLIKNYAEELSNLIGKLCREEELNSIKSSCQSKKQSHQHNNQMKGKMQNKGHV
jgi:CRISPR type III-B/RAMP module RAMP protein Cmr1